MTHKEFLGVRDAHRLMIYAYQESDSGPTKQMLRPAIMVLANLQKQYLQGRKYLA